MVGRKIKITKRLDKLYNKNLILDSLQKYKRLSIPEIAAVTKLSRPTVDTVINQFNVDGVVVKDGYAASDTGRKPALWKLNENSGFFVGIDFEPLVIRFLVLNMIRDVVYSKTIVFPENISVEGIIHLLVDTIEDIFSRKINISITKLKSISIGNPGEIDIKKGVSITMHNLPTWHNVPIVNHLEQHFQCSIYLENVILFMANVERDRMIQEGNNSFVYIAMRTGVGAGLCINGELYNGATGNSGHFGHIPMTTPLFKDSRCLEECSDSIMLLERMKQLGLIPPERQTNGITNEYIDQLIVEALAENRSALNIFEEIADYWAYGIACTSCLLDVPIYIIGGVLAYINNKSSEVGEFLLQAIRDKYQNKYQQAKSPVFGLRFAKYYEYTAALGGALYGYENYYKKSNPLLQNSLNKF